MVSEGLISRGRGAAARRARAGGATAPAPLRLGRDQGGARPSGRLLAQGPQRLARRRRRQGRLRRRQAAEHGRHAARPSSWCAPETNPDDVHGMIAAQGILTARGGRDQPRGRRGPRHGQALRRRRGGDQGRRRARQLHRVDGKTIREGDEISIDGTTGEVFVGAIPTDRSQVRATRRSGAAAAAGPTRPASWASGPTPTTRATRSRRASSAPRASASAAPSTCSSRKSACRSCSR